MVLRGSLECEGLHRAVVLQLTSMTTTTTVTKMPEMPEIMPIPKAKSRSTSPITPSLSCTPRCKKNGSMLSRPRRRSPRTLCQATDASISRIGGIATRCIRGIPRDVAVGFLLFCAVRRGTASPEGGTCGCAMLGLRRGRRVVRFSSGRSLMMMGSRFGIRPSQLNMEVLF